MRLPDLVAYQTAVQHPATAFGDADLRSGSVTAGRFGLPRAVAGNFAVTYQICDGSRRWAVRCFHRDTADRAQRYAAISETLQRVREHALVPITYLPLGVRVGQTWFPVTKMPWLDGVTLNRAVEQRLRQPAALRDLEQRFCRLVEQLRRHGLAHGDLQHGNILVDAADELRLVDYDGMFVPALKGLKASERGDPNYQHPARTDQFDAELDRFSALVIILALRALAAEPGLWRTYNSDDNLLFRRADFEHPAQSVLFRDLLALSATRQLAERLASACTSDFGSVPLLTEPAPAPVPVMKPLHVSILNRLYGGPRVVARKPKPAGRAWRVRRTTRQVALIYSPDGSVLITADEGGTLRLREALGGRTRQTLRQPATIVSLAYGRQLVGLLRDGTLVHLPMVEKRSPVQLWAPPRGTAPSAMAVASNAAWVAVGSASGPLRCWSVAAGKLVGAARQRGSVTCVAVSANGSLLASASAGPGIHLWALPGGRALHTLVTVEPVVHLAFSRDSRLLAAAAPSGAVLVWDVQSSQLVHEVPGTSPQITGLTFSPDARTVAFIAADGTVAVRPLPTATPRPQPAPAATSWLRTLLQRWA